MGIRRAEAREVWRREARTADNLPGNRQVVRFHPFAIGLEDGFQVVRIKFLLLDFVFQVIPTNLNILVGNSIELTNLHNQYTLHGKEIAINKEFVVGRLFLQLYCKYIKNISR